MVQYFAYLQTVNLWRCTDYEVLDGSARGVLQFSHAPQLFLPDADFKVIEFCTAFLEPGVGYRHTTAVNQRHWL